jgi:hypothetical protein
MTAIVTNPSASPAGIRLRQAQVRQDEEHPVCGGVLRSIEALFGDPPASGRLPLEDGSSPTLDPNPFSGGLDLAVVFPSPQKLSKREVADGGFVLL